MPETCGTFLLLELTAHLATIVNTISFATRKPESTGMHPGGKYHECSQRDTM